MTDPADIGARVLAALDAGRQRAIAAKQAAAQPLWDAVRRQLDVDLLDARPARGRPGRIQRAIRRHGFRVSSRHVGRILDALSSVSDSAQSNGQHQYCGADR